MNKDHVRKIKALKKERDRRKQVGQDIERLDEEITRLEQEVAESEDRLNTIISDNINRLTERHDRDVNSLAEEIAEVEKQEGPRGEQGERGPEGPQGPRGEKGESGAEITANEIKRKLQSLRGSSRLDASAIKNLPRGGGGTTIIPANSQSFLDLHDTPSSYSNQGNKLVTVNADTDGLEFETAVEAGIYILPFTTVNAATYDVLTTDYILHVTYTTTGAVTSLTLPTAQAVAGRVLTIKDAGGNSTVNTITIDTEGSETIDGEDTLIIRENYASVNLYSDGSNWFIY